MLMLNRVGLRSFATLVEEGSFTRTANRLNLTQAAISQHVAQIERRIGAVVIRRPRGVEPTPAGRALLAHVRELEQADRRLALTLADRDALRGEVGLITPGSVGLLLYPLLLDIQTAEPGLCIRHRFAPDPEIVAAVLDTRFDLGIATLRPDDDRLVATAFAEEPLELVVPADAMVHDWNDLERLGFIDHPDGQAMARRLLGLRFPRDPGIEQVPIRGFTNQVGLILEPVARGLGFTVIPQYARRAFERPEHIRVVGGDDPVVDTLWLIRRAEWPLTARARHVVDRLNAQVGGTRDQPRAERAAATKPSSHS